VETAASSISILTSPKSPGSCVPAFGLCQGVFYADGVDEKSRSCSCQAGRSFESRCERLFRKDLVMYDVRQECGHELCFVSQPKLLSTIHASSRHSLIEGSLFLLIRGLFRSSNSCVRLTHHPASASLLASAKKPLTALSVFLRRQHVSHSGRRSSGCASAVLSSECDLTYRGTSRPVIPLSVGSQSEGVSYLRESEHN
jgi:hypothetical protein